MYKVGGEGFEWAGKEYEGEKFNHVPKTQNWIK